MEDFHFASLHHNITPMVIHIPIGNMDHILIKVKGDITGTLEAMRTEWDLLYPELPFDYLFLDEHIGQMYQSDDHFSKLVHTFSGLAILLACLGLYGMISYNVDTKQKEIGIRKVLGASISTIVKLLSAQFLILVFVSAIVSIPLSWYFLSDWLSGFAFKISLSPFYFMAAVLIIILLSFLTMSLKTIKAGLSNPVDILKEE